MGLLRVFQQPWVKPSVTRASHRHPSSRHRQASGSTLPTDSYVCSYDPSGSFQCNMRWMSNITLLLDREMRMVASTRRLIFGSGFGYPHGRTNNVSRSEGEKATRIRRHLRHRVTAQIVTAVTTRGRLGTPGDASIVEHRPPTSAIQQCSQK